MPTECASDAKDPAGPVVCVAHKRAMVICDLIDLIDRLTDNDRFDHVHMDEAGKISVESEPDKCDFCALGDDVDSVLGAFEGPGIETLLAWSRIKHPPA